MMLGVNPADAGLVLKVLLDVWDTAAERMLLTVARRLARGLNAQDWAVAKTRETVAVRDELAAIVATLDNATPEIVARALAEAYSIGEAAAGTMQVPVVVSRPETVQRLAERLVTQLQGTHLPVISAHMDVYRKTVLAAELDMQTGTIDRRTAIATAVDRLLFEGTD
nr:minor capsid protein [Actinomycetota bacterium]